MSLKTKEAQIKMGESFIEEKTASKTIFKLYESILKTYYYLTHVVSK